MVGGVEIYAAADWYTREGNIGDKSVKEFVVGE